jgi:FOG: CBS domain
MEFKNPHDMMRERRQEQNNVRGELRGQEQRSREKVHEILREQDAFPDETRPASRHLGECERVAQRPVTEIMSGRVAVLSFDDTILTVQGIFSSVKFRHLPVVDERGYITGIISDRDFLRHVSPFYGTINEQTRDVEIMSRKVGMIMTRDPICIETNICVGDAIKQMNRKKISCLPVVEIGTTCLQGIVTWKDIVRAFSPESFSSKDSQRLKTGVHVNPESRESARLKAKSAESARLRKAAAMDESDRDAERLQRNRPDLGQTRPT